LKGQAFSAHGGLPAGLLTLGRLGHHPLFDAAAIRRAFARVDDGLIEQRALLGAHQAMRALAGLPGLAEMRHYLRALPEPTVDLLVYLYFRKLDQSLDGEDRTLH
jgi:hypothetical protein